MPAGADFAHRLKRQLRFVHAQRPQELGDHRQKIGVERHLLERGLQAPLHPARAMHEKVDAAHDRAPEREHALVGRLGVERIGRIGVRGAIWQAKAARQLSADDRRFHIFRRAEGRRARLHVHVRRESAIDEWRAWPRCLGHDEARERLGMLLRERAGERHRRHCASERERRHHHHLVAARHLDDSFHHRRVEPQWRRGVDDREQRGLALQRLIVEPTRNFDHLDGVQVALAPEAVGVDRLVGQRQHVEQRVEMADRGGNVDRLDRIAADEMNRIETLPEANEVLIVAPVAGPPASRAVKRIGGARHGAESDVPAAD